MSLLTLILASVAKSSKPLLKPAAANHGYETLSLYPITEYAATDGGAHTN